MSGARVPALGSLRERVQLEQRVQTIGAQGGHVTTYVPQATVWARVRSLSGSLVTYSDARSSRVSHIIIVRFRTDIKPGDRIIYRTKALEIIAAEDLNGRRAYLNCQCSAIESTG